MSLSKLFKPDSIAVVGASNNPAKVGNNILRNLIDGGFKGHLYPVNIKENEILNLKAYKSLLDIEREVDLVVVAVPARFVPDVLEDAGKKKVPFAIIISAGFKEIGAEGLYLENKIKQISENYNIRILGPNCLGIINLTDNVNASFSSIVPKKGNIAFISQSGALCTSILSLSVTSGFGFSKFISIGNKADIDEADLIEYLSEDASTSLILAYLESISDVQRFRRSVEKAMQKKPVVLLKAGNSKAGKAAIASHTGSMAGENKLYDALFSQLGIIRVNCLAELFDASEIFSRFTYIKNPKLGIITNGGGVGVIAADSAENAGIELGKISAAGVKELRKYLPANASFKNPLDVVGDARADRFFHSLKVIDKEKDINIILVILTPQSMTEVVKTAEIIADFSKKTKKLIVTCFIGNEERMLRAKEILNKGNIPNFDFPEMAINGIRMIYNFNMHSYENKPLLLPKADYMEVRRIIDKAKSENRKLLTMDEGFRILKVCHITPADYIVSEDLNEINAFLTRTGSIILKVDTSYEAHKTDVGFLSKKITNEKELKYWFNHLKSNAEKFGKPYKILAQAYSDGTEFIAGALKDKIFGNVVSIGFGGIYTEILKDVSFGISPLDERDAERMIHSLKLYPVIKGARNKKPLNEGSLIKLIAVLEDIIRRFKDIKEIEINPFMLTEKEGKAVDVLIKIDF